MEENKLQLVQNEISEALNTVENMEKNLSEETLSKESIKKDFIFLCDKLQVLEDALKKEGIL